MEKRYQVFVSSTFKDLEEERQEVMHALLELDCMPSGMELFPASNETQWNLINKVIDDCDYYVLILAGRYGSLGDDGLSYTEKEYRYALSIGKPIIAFLHRNPGNIIADKVEPTSEGKDKLRAFRAFAEKKLCKHWETPLELGSVVSRSLVRLIKSTPAVGWVRANELADQEATMELLRLRRRVEELQAELDRSRISAPKGSEGLAQGDQSHELRLSFFAGPPESINDEYYKHNVKTTWNKIFAAIAPLMIHEASESTLKAALDKFVADESLPGLFEADQFKGLGFRLFKINNEDFQTIKVQLRALGLMAKNDKARSVKDSDTYWTLTPYGDEAMTQLRAIRRNQTSSTIHSDITPDET